MFDIKICKLCDENCADKKNSHLIPKFLGKRLFENTTPRHTLILEPSGSYKKIQDTFKEDFIFCTSCEKRLEILETLLSKKLNNLSNYISYSKDFLLKEIQNQEFIECLQIESTELIIFIYSIIWRISISNLKAYRNFKLDFETEKYIQKILHVNLSLTKPELLENLKNLNLNNTHTICLMKSKYKNSETRGLQTSMKLSENLYQVFMNEIFVSFYSNNNNVPFPHSFFSLKQNVKPLIPVADSANWNILMQSVIRKTLNY